MSKEKKVRSILDERVTSKAYDGPFDKVIKGFAGTEFDAYYIRGEHVKLTNGAMVVDIYKPGKCQTNKAYYKDSIIKITSSDREDMTYADFLRLNGAVELAINLLNKERFNKIDRDVNKNYASTRSHRAVIKKRYKALDDEEIEVGGVYLDAKKTPWVYLGEEVALYYIDGPMLEDKEEPFRIGYNDGHYAYLQVTDNFNVSKGNVIVSDMPAYVLARKKRFYGKLGSIELTPEKSIFITNGDNIYKIEHNEKERKMEEL